MAKAERKSNPFGWIVLGALIGAVAVAGVLLMANTMQRDGDREDASPEIGATAPVEAKPPSKPVAAMPKSEPAAPAPVAAAPPPVPPPVEPSVDAQMADDAAAAGMTSRATPNPPSNDQPSN